jgi:phosphate transport system protein
MVPSIDRDARDRMATEHLSKQFEADLEALKREVLAMGTIAEQQTRYAVEALRRGDTSILGRFASEEERLNQLERHVDEMSATVLAKRTPTASDLRFVVGVLKMATDLERIGDEAKKIAAVALRTDANDRLKSSAYAEIQLVAAMVTDMLRRTMDGFSRLEVLSAPDIVRLDQEVDDYFRSTLRTLLTYMIEDPRTISSAIDLIFVAKALERIGDHAKNLSRQVVYIAKGEDVRHVSMERLEAAVRS